MPIEVTLLFITAFVNSVLSLFVLFGKRDKVNNVYSIFVLFASLWALGLALFVLESDPNRANIIANFYYIAAAGIPTFFLYFTLVFPVQKNISLIKHLLIFSPLIIISLGFLIDRNFLIKNIYLTYSGKEVDINYYNYITYSIFFVVFVVYSYLNIFKAYIASIDKDVNNQLKFIIIGTSIGYIFGMLFNLILPAAGDYQHIWVGPLFSFSMVASIGYSISKHHLFNIKVVATEISIFILWVVILIRTLLSETFNDQVTNGTIFLATVIIGVLIIRGVIKEVRLREELDYSNLKLKVANENQISLMHFMNHQVKGRFGNSKNIFAELLTDDYGKIPESARPLIEKGLDETNMGIDYVQNVLRGASAENGQIPYDMKPIDFKSIIEEAFAKEKNKAELKGLEIFLKVDEGEYKMQGDARQLGEAVRNLIDNSTNYTLNGSISIQLSADKYAIRLTITDTGVGITEEDKINLFKSGVRGKDSLKVNVNSTGYGLAFVKGVVDAHKGRVWAESEGSNKGATFFVEFPRV